MLTLAEIETAIRAALPPQHRPATSDLAKLLAAEFLRARSIHATEWTATAGIDIANLLGALAGTQIETAGTLISFGTNNQFGDITFGDIASGDIIKITLALPPPTPPPPPPELPPTLTRFTGRQAELSALEVQLRTSRMVVITGMAGIGKTAMAVAITARTVSPDQLFWHSFRVDEGVDVLIWGLAAFLARQGRLELWDLLNHTPRVGVHQPFELWIDQLVHAMHGQQCLICLDDLHLVSEDPLLTRLVSRLAVLVQSSSVSLLVTARTIPNYLHAVPVPLAGLTATDVATLVAAYGLHLSNDDLAMLHSATEGNPQFLILAIEALRRVLDPSLIIRTISESRHVERYLLSNLYRTLSLEEREVMGAVSVLLDLGGTRAALEVLLERGGLRTVLSTLADRALLTESERDGRRVYNQHTLVRTFYYDDLGEKRRQALHRRAAVFYMDVERNVLRAAIHAERAGDVSYAAALAADSYALLANGESRNALQLLARLADVPLDPSERARVLLTRGEIELMLGEEEAAQVAFFAARDTLAGVADDEQRAVLDARACQGLGELLSQSNGAEALKWLQRGLAAIRDREPAVASSLHTLAGHVLALLGRLDEAQAHLVAGLSLLPDSPSYERAHLLNNLSGLAFLRGDLLQAEECASEALQYARSVGNAMLLSQILTNLGISRFGLGRWNEAIAHFEAGLGLAQRLGAVRPQVMLEGNLGGAYLNTGDDDAATAHLSACLELAEQHDMPFSALTARIQLADLQLRMGNLVEAAAWCDAAEAQAHQLNAALDRLIIANLKAELLLNEHPTEAFQRAEEVIAAARKMSEPIELGSGLRTAGLALAAFKRWSEADAALAESIAIFETQHMIYEAARVRARWALALRHVDPDRSAFLFAQARVVFAQLGARRDLARLDVGDTMIGV